MDKCRGLENGRKYSSGGESHRFGGKTRLEQVE